MTTIVAPVSCPSCSALLERVKDQLFCSNNVDCPAQSTGKLINFCKKLKIKGFGESTIDKLGLANINDLIALTVDSAKASGFSDHMATKLVETIKIRLQEKIATNEFLAAASIPLVGESISSKLTGIEIDNLTFSLCKELGLGDKAAENLCEWVELEWPELKELWLPHLFTEVKTGPAKGSPVVVITGKLNDFKNRTDASKYLESLGFIVKSSVSKETNYLVCEDGTSGSSYQKAKSLNIPIITIKSLEEIK